MFVKLSLCLLPSLFFSVFGQTTYDWGCNHYGIYATDECISFSSGDNYFSCNGTILRYQGYAAGECGTDDATVTYDVTYDTSSDTYSYVGECMDSYSSCGYFQVTTTETGYTAYYLTMDVCYSSYMYSCSGSKLTAYSYTDSECTEGKETYYKNIDYYDTYSKDTYTITCVSGGSGSSASTQSITTAVFIVVAAFLAKLF